MIVESGVRHMFLTSMKRERARLNFFNQISDMVFLISVKNDGSFNYKDANNAAIRHLRLPKNFIGKSVHELMPKDLADTIVDNYQQSILQKQEITFVAPFVDHLGNKRWFESKVTPIFNDRGTCKQIIVVTRDITDHRMEKKGLTNAKKELELILKYAPIALSTFDEKGNYLKVNPGFTKLFGWTNEELVSHSAGTILPPEMEIEFHEIIRELKKGHFIENRVTERITKSGNIVSVLASYSPVFENEKLSAVIATYKDITKQKVMETLLKESERRFRNIAEHSSDLIRIINREGTILYASPSHLDILGIPADFFINKSALSFVYPDDMNKAQEAIDIILKTKAPQAVEIRRLDKQRKIIWMEAIGTPILDAHKEIEQILFISRDIRKRKAEETKLKHLAFHDALTNLPNRRLFDNKLTKSMKLSSQRRNLMAVLVLDCDHFKNINDTYGHDVGDKVIKHFAERIKHNLRDHDMVSRMGGDEFTGVLCDLEIEEDAIAIVQRIIKTMQVPFLIGDYKLKLTTSIGIAFYRGERKTKRLLLEEADRALYDAKMRGKNTYAVFKNKKDDDPPWIRFKHKLLKRRAK